MRADKERDVQSPVDRLLQHRKKVLSEGRKKNKSVIEVGESRKVTRMLEEGVVSQKLGSRFPECLKIRTWLVKEKKVLS